MDFYSLIPIYVNIIHVRMNKVIFILYPILVYMTWEVVEKPERMIKVIEA